MTRPSRTMARHEQQARSLTKGLLFKLSAICLSILLAESLPAQWVQFQNSKIDAGNPMPGSRFGNSVDVSDDLMIVGAKHESSFAFNAGAAYVFRTEGLKEIWNQEAILRAQDRKAYDEFGWDVAIEDGLALVAAPMADPKGTNSGAVYVFRYDELNRVWTQEAKLVPVDGKAGDRFGYSVALSNGVALIGAPFDDDLGIDSGSAYLFHFEEVAQAWRQLDKWNYDFGQAYDQFGHAVDLHDDLALIGMPFDDTGAQSNHGSVSLFRDRGGSQGWKPEQLLKATDAAAGDLFGFSVALDSVHAIVGAPFDDDSGVDAGSAYLFRANAQTRRWNQRLKIQGDFTDSRDAFGTAVAISDEEIVVGAMRDEGPNGLETGAAYLFEWLPQTQRIREFGRLWPSDGQSGDEFGQAAISAGRVVVGVGEHSSQAVSSGTIYSYDLYQMTARAIEISSGSSAKIGLGSTGAPGLRAGASAVVELTQIRPSSPSRLFFSTVGLGSTYISAFHVNLALQTPFAAAGLARSNVGGEVHWKIDLPTTLQGKQVWMQVAQPGSTTHVATTWVE